MIAPRYLAALAVLLALAGIPTALHSYMGATITDGRSAAALPRQLNGLNSQPGKHSLTWVMDTYGTADYIEREYDRNLTLFVARSYDAKRLYHHPENGVAHGEGYGRAKVVRQQGRPDVPMFLLENAHYGRSVYALLYNGEFVDRPIRFQLQNALTLLVRPRALMTLFFVRAKNATTASSATSPPEALLLAAIDSFAAQPGAGSQ
jgi:hypothetical protein